MGPPADPWIRAGCEGTAFSDPLGCQRCTDNPDCSRGVCVRTSDALPVWCTDGHEDGCQPGLCLPRCNSVCLESGWDCHLEIEFRRDDPMDLVPPDLVCSPVGLPYICMACTDGDDCGDALRCVRTGADGGHCLPFCRDEVCLGRFGRCDDVELVGQSPVAGRACVPREDQRFRCECDGRAGTFARCERDGQVGVAVCLEGGGSNCVQWDELTADEP